MLLKKRSLRTEGCSTWQIPKYLINPLQFAISAQGGALPFQPRRCP